FFFFQAEEGIRDRNVTGVQTCALPILTHGHYDHTGGVAGLQSKWPEVPVYLNRRDVYEDAYTQQLFPPLSGDVRDYDEGDTVAEIGRASRRERAWIRSVTTVHKKEHTK